MLHKSFLQLYDVNFMASRCHFDFNDSSIDDIWSFLQSFFEPGDILKYNIG